MKDWKLWLFSIIFIYGWFIMWALQYGGGSECLNYLFC